MKANGFLPYMIKDNKIYFLLGKEESGLYSDFGGLKNTGESDFENAVREFNEETMDIFKDIKPTKITKFTNNNYNCYLTKLDNSYQDRITAYNNFRQKISNYKAKNGLLEKQHIQWFKPNQIINNKSQMRPTFYDTFIKLSK